MIELHRAGLHRHRSRTATATSAARRPRPPRAGGADARRRPPAAAPAGAEPARLRPARSPASASHADGVVRQPRQRAARAPPGRRHALAPGGSGRTSTRLRGARLGAGPHDRAAEPVVDPLPAIMAVAEVPGGAAGLPELRQPGRPLARRPARPHRRLLPATAGRRSRSRPKLKPGRPRRRPVRGGRLPRARRPRLDLPGEGQERLRPLGGPQGPAELRRPGRAGRGDRRAPVPRRRSSTR